MALRWAEAPGTPAQWQDEGRMSAFEAAKACDRCRKLNDWSALAPGEFSEVVAARRFTTAAWASGLVLFGGLFLVPFFPSMRWVSLAAAPVVLLVGIGLRATDAARDTGRGVVVGAGIAMAAVLAMALIGLAKYGS